MQAVQGVLRCVVVALPICACAAIGHRVGGKAAEGAVQQVQKELEERPPEEQGKLAEQAGRGAVRGAVAEMSSPEVQEATNRIAEKIANDVIQHLEQQLGAAGSGPLSEALAGASQRVTAAAAQGAIDEVSAFAAQCSDADPQRCLERQVHRLGAAAGAGVLEAMRLPFALLCFGLGFATCLVLVLFIQRTRKGTPSLSLHRKHA